jgi:hypothetical protein
MGEQYCEKYKHLKHVGDTFPFSVLKRLIAESEEIEEELASITTCPAPCEDGRVLVSPPSGKPRKLCCPVVSHYCAYGVGLEDRLDARLRKIMLESGLPRRHIEHFDGYFQTESLAWANRWNFRSFLVLTGASGTGKSFGAAWAVREYLMSRIPDLLDTRMWNCADIAGRNVMWCSANKIIHDRDLASRACAKTLLVLDDLGREGDAQIRRADVSDVISARYDAKLPTVITTELTFSDITRTYGACAAQKLTEDKNGEGYGGMIADCGESLSPEHYEDGESNGELSWDPDDDDTFYFEAQGKQ